MVIDIVIPHHYEGLLDCVISGSMQQVPSPHYTLIMDSAETLKRHGEPHNDIIQIPCEPNTGKKIYKAAILSNKPWILILADDTILLDGFWEAVSKYMKPDIGAIVPRGYFCFRDLALANLLSSLKWNPHILQWKIAGSLLIRTELIRSCDELLEYPMREDAALMYHVLRKGYAIRNTDEYVSVHSPHIPYEITCLRTVQRGAFHDPMLSIFTMLWRTKCLVIGGFVVKSALPLAFQTIWHWAKGFVGNMPGQKGRRGL